MARKSYDMVNEILAHFDFEKVHTTMYLLNWKWFDKADVPTVNELKESAEQRLYDAIKQAINPNNTEHHEVGWVSASGGFKATAWKNEDGTLAKVLLEFIVTDWDADDSLEEAES